MTNFQTKKNWRRIFQSKPFLVFLSAVVLIFAWSVYGFWNKMQETSKNMKIIEDKVAELKLKKENLSANINNLNTEEGKEKIFRENFGLVKEGEGVIIVVEDKNKIEPPKAENSSKITTFFKNLFK
ncbi:septum formation initiator family protein [Candidatus Nomurabacteria bacterium]|nr:septum formation initiator family protein [Candidatus Nomurabacteria bacterium]